MEQVAVDLETLGTGSNAVIVAIGAKIFDTDLADPTSGDEFYVRVDGQTGINAGMQVDMSTVLWWMQQSPAAQAELLNDDRLSLATALQRFSAWYPEGAPLWGNGATFDNVILQNAYTKCHQQSPWSFWNDRDLRTLKAIRPDVNILFFGTPHHALHDARHQALVAWTLLKQLEQ